MKFVDYTPPDENERSSAFTWLHEDLGKRAIESPTELDAILNMYAYRVSHPEDTVDRAQFSSPTRHDPNHNLVRLLSFHLYMF